MDILLKNLHHKNMATIHLANTADRKPQPTKRMDTNSHKQNACSVGNLYPTKVVIFAKIQIFPIFTRDNLFGKIANNNYYEKDIIDSTHRTCPMYGSSST